MVSRIVLVLLTLFWLTMNALLWRAEYGVRPGAGGSPVPAAVVWKKILTAPDSSSLTIWRHRKRIGFCQWVTSVGESLASLKEDQGLPEGMVERVAGYRIQIEGNLEIPDFAQRARIEGSLRLGRDKLWRELSARLSLRPAFWEIHSRAATKTVVLKMDDGERRTERAFEFSELQHPERLLLEVAGPLVAGLVRSLGFPSDASAHPELDLGVRWEAREDSVKLGHASVRAYRVQARWLHRYDVVIFVSRVGEILRVELPDEILLLNDQLAPF